MLFIFMFFKEIQSHLFSWPHLFHLQYYTSQFRFSVNFRWTCCFIRYIWDRWWFVLYLPFINSMSRSHYFFGANFPKRNPKTILLWLFYFAFSFRFSKFSQPSDWVLWYAYVNIVSDRYFGILINSPMHDSSGDWRVFDWLRMAKWLWWHVDYLYIKFSFLCANIFLFF
jgi:hypothetical protein